MQENGQTLDPEEFTTDLTIKEYSEQHSIPEKTIRSWIKAEKLDAHQVSGKYGMEWRIPSSALPVAKPSPPVSTTGQPGPPPDAWKELLQRHEAATVRLGYLEAQAEQVKMLTAGQDEERRKAEEARIAAAQESAARQAIENEAARLRREGEELKERLARVEEALAAERAKGWVSKLLKR